MLAPAPFESVCCNLCGADDAALLVIKHGYRVLRCRRCALVYVSPRPKSADLATLYTTESFVGHQLSRAGDESWQPEAVARATLLTQIGPARGRLLDVGCSTGWFLNAAQGAGWKVVGIDLSAPAVAHCRARGFDARLATLSNHDLAPSSFDAITMFDSIEHMPSPLDALRETRRLLAPGGLVMITTPNVEGLLPRLTLNTLGRAFGVWDHPGPPGHVFQFGRKTLRSALENTGFEIVVERTETIPLPHTVGELEDALLDVLKGPRQSAPVQAAPATAATPAPPAAASPGTATKAVRRIGRGIARATAWTVAASVGLPAPLFGAGDSLLVIARARRDPG